MKVNISCYVQIILNSTTWELDSHGDAYKAMKEKLGLDAHVNKLSVVF
jgi:hypothetical protein